LLKVKGGSSGASGGTGGSGHIGTTGSLSAEQMSELDAMLHIEKKVWMENYKTHNSKNVEFSEYCNKHLEMVNFLLRMIHRCGSSLDLVWFKDHKGHILESKNRVHRLLYCSLCRKLITKADCQKLKQSKRTGNFYQVKRYYYMVPVS